MGDLLDVGLRQLFEDRAATDRVTRAICLDQGCAYIDALERLHQAAADTFDAARRPLSGEQATLRFALARAGDADYLEQTIRTLERRDQAVGRAYERAVDPVMLEQRTDPTGLVLLDQGDGPNVGPKPDIGTLLTDPAEHERRLARARAVAPIYRGDEGRKLFEEGSQKLLMQPDREHLEKGRDLVLTLERQHAEQQARAAAGEVAKQLDAAIADAGRERSRLKQLDAQLSQLEGPGSSGARDAARDQLRQDMVSAAEQPVMMLDQIDAPSQTPATLEGVSQVVELEADRLHDRIKHLDSPTYLKALERYGAGEDIDQVVADLQAPAAPAPETPSDVNPSRQLDQQVRQRMLDASVDYVTAFEQLIQEGKA